MVLIHCFSRAIAFTKKFHALRVVDISTFCTLATHVLTCPLSNLSLLVSDIGAMRGMNSMNSLNTMGTMQNMGSMGAMPGNMTSMHNPMLGPGGHPPGMSPMGMAMGGGMGGGMG